MNNSGISLLEALIATALAALAAMAVAEVCVLGVQGAATVTTSLFFDSIVSNIRMALKGDYACTLSLQGAHLVTLPSGSNYGDPTTGTPVNTIYSGNGVAPVYVSGTPYGNVANLSFLLYDLGATDSLPPFNNVPKRFVHGLFFCFDKRHVGSNLH
jgi:hypothetical protein